MGEAFISRRGGGYNVYDILTSDKYETSIEAVRIVDFTPIGVIIDSSYIYLITSTTSCYKYNRLDFSLASSVTNYPYSRSHIRVDDSKIYTLIAGAATTKAGLQYISKSDLNLYDIKVWEDNSWINVFCYDKSGDAVPYAISYWDSGYEPYYNYVTYYYSDEWHYLKVYDDNYQINALVIDGTAIYAYKRTGTLYKIDATTNSVTLTKSIGVAIGDNQMIIRGDYIFIKSNTELKKYDKSGNLISSLTVNGSMNYSIEDNFIYVTYQKTIYKIDTNLNIVWSKIYDFNIYSIHKYSDSYAILENKHSTYSRVTTVVSQTGNPDYSIKIKQ